MKQITVKRLLTKRYKTMAFTGIWQKGIGQPERAGTWLIWGSSSNGKSSFTMQLAKYLTNFDKVAYDSLEEGSGLTMQKLAIRYGLGEVSKKFVILERAKKSDLIEILSKRKGPGIVIVDSLQYLGISKKEYEEIKELHKDKLIIYVSHADGKEPSGAVAKYIRYDSDVKIRVEGFKAFINTRYEGGEPITIWEEGAIEYWGN